MGFLELNGAGMYSERGLIYLKEMEAMIWDNFVTKEERRDSI